MLTYTTIDGRTFDLSRLDDRQHAYLADASRAYHTAPRFADFMNDVVHGTGNPLLIETQGWVTDAAWHHPLYRALRDLAARLGIAQGELRPEGAWREDPFADAWLSPTEAAREKGVTRTALHKAIARGDILACPAQPGGTWLRVSRNSLARWTPNKTRQAAGRRTVTSRS